MYPDPSLIGVPPGAIAGDQPQVEAMSPLKRAMMMQMMMGGQKQQPQGGGMGVNTLNSIMPALKMLIMNGGGMGA